jgi:hypothetical protein
MPAYRTYLLDRNEHIDRMIEQDADDDETALTAALALSAEHAAVEVWERARLVARVGAEFTLSGR